jgi:hypothetical protein
MTIITIGILTIINFWGNGHATRIVAGQIIVVTIATMCVITEMHPLRNRKTKEPE